jgi:hypothetical protein
VACQIDNLAEHFLLHIKPALKNTSAERDRIAASNPIVGIIRDIHDTHKHGRLTRRNAKITKGQNPTVVHEGGAIGSAPIGAAPIGGDMPRLIVRLDDGSSIGLVDVIQNALAYWESEMRRHGL